MLRAFYDDATAKRLRPLLLSISRELHERSLRLELLELRIERVASGARPDASELRRLTAEASTHRRELRYAHGEIERLGCSIVGETPLTFRIPVAEGDRSRSVLWQPSLPVGLESCSTHAV